MKKRLMSLLLVLCMVLTMVPMTVFAEDAETVTIYFENTQNWHTVNAYFWSGSNYEMTSWPGVTMTNVEEDIWSIDVPADAEWIIFNDTTSTQTSDLSIPTDGKNLYTYGGAWSVYGEIAPEEPEHEHTFEGNYWRAEEDGHYPECDTCTYYIEELFEEHADDDEDGYCDVCYFAMSTTGEPVEPEAGPFTIYFDNTENWDSVYAYYWFEDEGTLNSRPSLAPNPFGNSGTAGDIVLGEEMTFVEGSFWSIEVPGDTNRVIFNDGGTAKTGELTIPSDYRNLYTYSTEEWTVYGETPIKILEQPVDDCAAIGETYQVSVTAEGEGLTYQWYLKNEGADTWHESAVKTSRYRGTMTNARANREVYCVITDVYGNQVTSETAKLNLKPTELKIIQQPQDCEAAKGEPFKVTVKAEGDGLTYQWYLKNVGSEDWYQSAVKSASYKGNMSDATAGRQLYCVITDRYGDEVISEIVTLKRIPTELKIVTQPVDDEAALKETYEVSVEAEGDGLKYQWYLKNAGSDTWYASAVKSRNYRGTMTKARANRQVYCVITDAYGNEVKTDTVTISCPDV